MDTTGEGCANFFMWLAIGLVVMISLVIPVTAFMFDPYGVGLPVLFLGLSGFLYFIGSFFGFEDNRVFEIVIYGCASLGVILLLRFFILYIRDLFVKDPRSGMAEVVAIPVAAVVYGLVIWLLPEGLSEGSRKSLLKVVKLLVILIVSGLVYLIYR